MTLFHTPIDSSNPSHTLLDKVKHIGDTADMEKLEHLEQLTQYVSTLKGMEERVSDVVCEAAIGHVIHELPNSKSPFETLYLANAAIALVGYTAVEKTDNDYVAPVVHAILQKANAEYIANGDSYMPNVYNSVAMLIHKYGDQYELTAPSLMSLGNSTLEGMKAETMHLTSITKPFNALMDRVQQNENNVPSDALDYFTGSNIVEKNNWGKQIVPIISAYQKVAFDVTHLDNPLSMAELGKQKNHYKTVNNLMFGLSMGF